MRLELLQKKKVLLDTQSKKKSNVAKTQEHENLEPREDLPISFNFFTNIYYPTNMKPQLHTLISSFHNCSCLFLL